MRLNMYVQIGIHQCVCRQPIPVVQTAAPTSKSQTQHSQRVREKRSEITQESLSDSCLLCVVCGVCVYVCMCALSRYVGWWNKLKLKRVMFIFVLLLFYVCQSTHVPVSRTKKTTKQQHRESRVIYFDIMCTLEHLMLHCYSSLYTISVSSLCVCGGGACVWNFLSCSSEGVMSSTYKEIKNIMCHNPRNFMHTGV